jgi:hypothetical protein
LGLGRAELGVDVTAWQAWYWVGFLRALDAAGYAIVAKPTLTRFGPK